MKAKWVKHIIIAFAVILAIGIVAFFLLPPPGVIPVLFYHFVSKTSEPSKLFVTEGSFERQVAFLKLAGYRVLSLDEFYAIKTGKIKAPLRAVVLTFDDCSNWFFYHTALPILTKYKTRAANFLVYDCARDGTQDSMSFAQARDAVKKGITIGSHSLTHPNFSEIDSSRLRREIFESKRLLEKELGIEINYFSYPFGIFTPEAIGLVKEAGYHMAFATGRMKASEASLYAIPRVKISRSSDNLFAFWFRISGLYQGWYQFVDIIRPFTDPLLSLIERVRKSVSSAVALALR